MSNVSIKRRFISIIYDTLLILSLMFLGTIPFIALRYGEAVEGRSFDYQLTLFLIIFLFLVGFWSISGRTLGMQSWGIKIETFDGLKPNILQCSIRFFSAILSWLPLGLGFWWQVIDRNNLTWHDHISKTRLRYRPRK